jgi:L-rhamnose mutarotase
MRTTRYCLALDLKDDPKLIAAYEQHHEKVWPEILESISSSGILSMEIYRVENRLFMIMETEPGFRVDHKEAADESNQKVREWEELMWRYQQTLPNSKPGEKWRIMERIFVLEP